MNYNNLPEGNQYIEKRDRNQAKKLRAPQAKLIAQYKYADVSMVIYDWHGDEYEEPYVIMIHTGEIDKHSLHRPKFDRGIYSPDTVINCINALLNYRRNYLDSNGDHKFSDQIRSYINEPWNSFEEYKKEIHGSAKEEWDEEKELRELHELAREEWNDEKRSRRIIEELEVNKHEYNIPKMPEVPEEIDEIHCRYTNGDITLIEMQREIENAMSNT